MRNYSVRIRPEGASLAPLYDLSSALPLRSARTSPLSLLFPMIIGGERKFRDIDGRAWAREWKSQRVNVKTQHKRLYQLAIRLPDAARAAAERLSGEGVDNAFLRRMVRLLDARVRVALKGLATS